MAAKDSNPSETRLDKAVTTPSTTAPGDGPADTTDPTERASTVGGDKAAAAEAGHLTVNAAVPVDSPEAPASDSKPRTERYEAVRPDGTKVTVERNIETGESMFA